MVKWLLTLSLILLGVGSGFVYYLSENYFEKPLGQGQTNIIFEVHQGESFHSIGRRLEESQLITNARLLNLMARFYNYRGKMRAGEYALNDGLNPKEILEVLSSGKSINYPFTVTEGLNSYEIALLFEKQGYGNKQEFLEACTDVPWLQKILSAAVKSCEGYLYPETYNFEKKTTAHQMIERMVKGFLSNYEQVAHARSLGNWSRHQVLTMASLIEKETGAPEERPLIASVFFNRLRQRMRLQTDPSVQYGVLATTGVYPMNITKRDLLTATPYNTYTQDGLPPGPIANPGKDAIRSVFEPANSEYIYFVSRNDGTHTFTKTYQEHLNAVKEFQLNRKAREGKSWRDLKENRRKTLSH